MPKKDIPDAVSAATVLREPAETRHADQLEALRQNDDDTPPAAWKLSPRSVFTYIVGGKPLKTVRKSLKDVPAKSAESDAMSKALQKAGFKFVGSTICYAFMQASGMVDDHIVGCHRHKE